jgi:flagellar basal body-associated protein FliL
MILRLVAGIWLCVVALGSSFGMTQWKMQQAASHAADAKGGVKKAGELRKLKSITVPLIAGGQVQGYLVAQFAFMIDNEASKQFDTQPDAFVSDEAFRLLYADEKLDYKNLDRFNIPNFAAAVKANVNARLKTNVVADVLVQEFNFINAEDVRR